MILQTSIELELGADEAMAGYSGTPLIGKLGIKPGARVTLANAPAGFDKLLGTMPPGARTAKSGQVDFSIVFATTAKMLTRRFAQHAKRSASDGLLWVAWPKKAAKMETDLSENVVRRIGLAHGMVDVKVCAIDETWSGLKFVFRLQDRRTTSPRPSCPEAAKRPRK